MRSVHRWCVGLVLGAALAFGGCNQTLFSEADPYDQTRIDRYWDGDSAQRTTAERQKRSEPGMGFGFPAGMADQ